MPTPMDAAAVSAGLADLAGWQADGSRVLTKTFNFKDHIEAFGFVTRVAMCAEVLNHHPDLRIVYNRVEIALSSHDAGGVTSRDLELARKIEGVV